MSLAAIIKKPLITEKSLLATKLHRFTFKVATSATKNQIKQAIETTFKVSVVGLRTSIMTSKNKRTAKSKIRHEQSWKKAIVQLKPGEKIDLFDIKTE